MFYVITQDSDDGGWSSEGSFDDKEEAQEFARECVQIGFAKEEVKIFKCDISKLGRVISKLNSSSHESQKEFVK